MSLFSQTPFGESDAEPIPEEEFRVLDKLASKVIEWRMAPAAIVALESSKPLNYISSQGMVFLGPVMEPLLEMFFNYHDYDILRQALERRSTIEHLIQMIERYDFFADDYDRQVKKLFKTEKKKWKWYQRWLGINQPKVEPPENLKNFDWRKQGYEENKRVFLAPANDKPNSDSS